MTLKASVAAAHESVRMGDVMKSRSITTSTTKAF
jgi:hypothetical protein